MTLIKKREKRIFNAYTKIDEATFELGGETFTREKVVRPAAVACLIKNVETNDVILVRQHRYAVEEHESEDILEVVAGKIDDGETPREAIKREIFEEIGYEIDDSNLSQPIITYPSIGYSTEKIYLFAGFVVNANQKTEGGGLTSEHENINIVHMNIDSFNEKIRTNEIKDAKTILCSNILP